MKIYILEAHESWIVDRISKEWKQYNKETIVSTPEEADILWILAQWRWRKIPTSLLETKKVDDKLYALNEILNFNLHTKSETQTIH